VGTAGITDYVAQAPVSDDPEREEFEWLLASGALGRSDNIRRVLRYICEEHFQGRADQIKEYTVATEALGRRSGFDPQTDTIVRVTIHALRKRLLDIYQNEGASRPIRLVIPPGHYAPSFIPHSQRNNGRAIATETESGQDAIAAPAVVPPLMNSDSVAIAARRFAWRPRPRLIFAVLLLVAIAGGLAWHQVEKKTKFSSAAVLLPSPQDSIHALMGSGRKPYVDHSGNTWATGNYCQGGSNVAVSPQRIAGTEDDPLYFGGVRGIAHCVFPVTQGLYELHFHFAETSDLPMATRVATLSINAGPQMGVDVVDDAGGDDIATSKVLTGIAPEGDGSIHVDFISDVSLLNAVEILPSPTAKLLPVRIVAGSSPVIDDAKQFWASDRYFSGGRHGLHAQQASLGIYESARIGRFRYTIPAVPLAHYRLRLYFREPWFGRENGGYGGPGSRVFDVACNGALLLKNFDILAEDGSKPTVKTFDHLQASADGKVEIYFMPVVNYPVVSALELVPED
jgi:Malectin domain